MATAKTKTEKHAGGAPRQWKTVEAMSKAIEAYFDKCDARTSTVAIGGKLVETSKPEPYIVQRLAVFLDLTMKGLSGYESREQFGATIRAAKARIEANKVLHMLDGDGYGPGYIFDLKNNYPHWKDSSEVSVLNNPELQVILDIVVTALKPFDEAGEVVQEALDRYADEHGD